MKNYSFLFFSICFFLAPFLLPAETISVSPPWGLSRQKFLTDRAKLYSIDRYPIIKFPISVDTLKDFFEKYDATKIELVGYGSLLNRASAAKTIPMEVIKTFHPVVCFGGKRIFERNITKNAHWGEKMRPNDNGMLNVIPVNNLNQMFNGVSMLVTAEELADLAERETGYNLIPMVTLNWAEAIDLNNHNPHFFVAYTFSSPEPKRGEESMISPCVNPVPGYSYATMAGAVIFGEAFLKFWIDTTYLSDRKTPFILWLKNPDINCDCQRGCSIPNEKKS